MSTGIPLARLVIGMDRDISNLVYSLLKPLVWVGSSLDDIRTFPSDARQRAGRQLLRIQKGLEPTDWKPLAGIGAGVREIRVHAGREFRVCYVAVFAEAIYVLSAFEKKTQRLDHRQTALIRARLSAVRAARMRQRRNQ